MLDVGRHPNIELLTYSEVEKIDGEAGDFRIFVRKKARFIEENKCTGCGSCAEACPVVLPSEHDEGMGVRKATYKQYAQAIPGIFTIQKTDLAPCRMGCPVHLNVQGYVAMVKMGKYREAIEIIMRDLPFPGVLGRICPHKCEKSCRRLEVDEAISIRELKKVAADHVNLDDIPVPEIEPKKERVVVIGSGPAGLTAAYFLALDGYPVDVYESMPEAGGMMRYGIPEHRLPRSVLDAEINNLKRYGINIHTNSVVGKDVTLKELKAHGAKAIFLAIGAWKGLKLRIPGEDTAQGVSDVTTFLREVHLKHLTRVTGKMVVIGGGHSALDAARVSLRLGANEAHIIYRRGRQEMLAEPEEVEEAEKEGVKIHFLVAPVSISEENGKVSGIECIRTRLTEPDATGRRKPVPIEGSNFFIEADHIIPAIGQEPDFDILGKDHGLAIGKWGMLTVNPETLQTNVQDIFAGGDAVTGPATVIEAVEMGKRAAKYMARYLKGEELPTEWEEGEPMGENWTEITDQTVKSRVKIPTLPVEKRLSGFDEVNLTLDEVSARAEAARCVDCGGCCECYQCVKACEAKAVTLDSHAQEEKTVAIDAGAIIVATGYDLFDPSRVPEYNYREIPNVVTAIEFERLLSASGPTGGHLDRPSDRAVYDQIADLENRLRLTRESLDKFESLFQEASAEFYKIYQKEGTGVEDDRKRWAESYETYVTLSQSLEALKKKAEGFSVAKKLAFIQCVGSRDLRFYPFCSGYCCMHSIKEAIIAHEHEPETTSTIFGMDIRAVGKGFEEYKIRGGNKSGITYVRGRVAEITEGPNQNPVITYEDTSERKVKSEEFDLVILATACIPNRSNGELAEILNIAVDEFGFYKTTDDQPLDTTRSGIFVCGCAHSPMDIPESVAQASSAAARTVETLTALTGPVVEKLRKAS